MMKLSDWWLWGKNDEKVSAEFTNEEVETIYSCVEFSIKSLGSIYSRDNGLHEIRDKIRAALEGVNDE